MQVFKSTIPGCCFGLFNLSLDSLVRRGMLLPVCGTFTWYPHPPIIGRSFHQFKLTWIHTLHSSSTNVILLASHIQLRPRKRTIPKVSAKQEKQLARDHAQIVVQEDDFTKFWEESRKSLSALNFITEEADMMLKKAFGWVHSPYWGEEREKEVPQVESVNYTLDYLKSLGLKDDDLHKILKKFPELMGCSLEQDLKANVATLEREWGIKEKTLRNLLLRNPKVLGYNVDCKGDCMAKCTRCWVRF
ncbi:hypothetical protein HPP92_003142 [Vanilla planifolia]|uniref:Mitochondrial transcription termination factor family protein n=1 Tax=Vanilla planifolia TaxID=51239 RepID=A0A835S1P3_VANPL|nr:hypothetical protein HPP92_003142 [Vanilla planifolia]